MHKKKFGHQVKGGDLLCYHKTHIWNAVCSSGMHNIRHGSIGTNPKKAMKMAGELEDLSYTEELKELGLSSLEKSQGRPHCTLLILKKDRGFFFYQVL